MLSWLTSHNRGTSNSRMDVHQHTNSYNFNLSSSSTISKTSVKPPESSKRRRCRQTTGIPQPSTNRRQTLAKAPSSTRRRRCRNTLGKLPASTFLQCRHISGKAQPTTNRQCCITSDTRQIKVNHHPHCSISNNNQALRMQIANSHYSRNQACSSSSSNIRNRTTAATISQCCRTCSTSISIIISI